MALECRRVAALLDTEPAAATTARARKPIVRNRKEKACRSRYRQQVPGLDRRAWEPRRNPDRAANPPASQAEPEQAAVECTFEPAAEARVPEPTA